MFDNNIRVESVPKRVYEFCRIASKKDYTLKEIQQKLAPFEINETESVSQYFSYVKDAANELGLIEIIQNDTVKFIGNKDIIQDLFSFRRYCNSIVWQDKNTLFYKIASIFLESNLNWLIHKSFTTSSEVYGEMRNHIGEDSDLNKHILGERFWLSFLGFGYINERSNGISFLPNMYTALKDFITLNDVTKNVELTIGSFLNKISKTASVALKNIETTKQFNFAFSSALRQLHDNKEIELKRQSDSKEIWYLFELQSHEIKREITHIIIKDLK